MMQINFRAALVASLVVGSALAQRGQEPDPSRVRVGDLAPPPGAAAAQAPAGPGSSALALAALDRRIADLDAEEAASKKELSELGGRLALAKTQTRDRGRAYYKLTRTGMLPVGAGFDALVTHAIRVERARKLLAKEVETERRLRERGGELARGLERIAKDRVALANQRTAMDAARLAMADETQRQQAFDSAFNGGTGSSDYVAIYGGNGAPDSHARGFADAKGRLLFPVAGRAEARPARREGTDGPGVEIRANLGSSVRAVFAGRVAFADRYGPYGRLVILDHGDHYYTVSANLASIDVKVGAEVTAGERIGTVGDEGKGPVLYFEVRHRTETIAPGPWLGL
jgi:septal ring factor EnvC (AmiA/AmiB activator)